MSHSIPFFPYRLWFVYIEPFVSVFAAYQIAFESSQYLAGMATLSKSDTPPLNMAIQVILWELSGILLLTAYQGLFILRKCKDEETWTAFAKGHLFGDFIHLIAMLPMGFSNFWQVRGWDSAFIGNFGFVYMAVSIRLSYMLGLGFKSNAVRGKQKAL